MRALKVLLLVSFLLEVPNASASETAVPVVAGKTVVSATKSGFIDVWFPSDARVSNQGIRNPDFAFEGRGRVVGLVLVRRGVARDRAFGIDLTRWDFCGKRGCQPTDPFEFATAHNWKRSQLTKRYWIIPAGSYRMYVITDGAAVRLEVNFTGLTGETHLRPGSPATIGVRQPQLRTPSGQENIVVAEDSFEMTSPGLMVEATQESPQLGLGLNSACYTRRGVDHLPSPGDPFAKGFCGGGLSVDPSPDFDVVWGSYAWFRMPQGQWDSTFSYTYAGQTRGMDFLNLWVSFD